MKLNRSLIIWICFLGSNILSLTGFILVDNYKNLGDTFLIISLVFLAGFLATSYYEILAISGFSKSEKIIWPVLIIVLSVFGQIAYLVKRKSIEEG
jgi:hypothetical protein